MDRGVVGQRAARHGASVNGELFRRAATSSPIHLPAALRTQAIDVAERALDAVRHYRFEAGEQNVISTLSVSAGIALYPFHGNDVLALLSNVDIAMYQAKELGRNRHMVFDQSSENLRNTHKRIHWAKKARCMDEDGSLCSPAVSGSRPEAGAHEILVSTGRRRQAILPEFIDLAESWDGPGIDMRVVESCWECRKRRSGRKIRTS